MSAEEMNEQTDAASHGDSAGDTAETLSGGEDGNFVVSAEKKPLNRTTLVLIMVLAVGGGALYLMHRRTAPAAAVAAPQSVAASQTISQFLNGGDTSIRGV